MNKNLLILGAGQYGVVVKEIAEEMGCFEKISFLDDSYSEQAENFNKNLVGKISPENLENLVKEYAYGIVAMGNAEKRLQFMTLLEKTGFCIPTIISNRAYLSKSAQLSKGVVLEPLAGVHAHAIVGAAAYISMGAVINHNGVVEQGCHIDNNAVVMSGAVVEEKIRIAPGVIVWRK